jgi:hypothetical protein
MKILQPRRERDFDNGPRGQIHPAPAAAARGMKELCSGDDKKA